MPRNRKATGAYHHGDLRRALLDDALRFIERHGLATLSLRDLARRLGVSPSAPYHHFPDRAALLVELAELGFAQLLEAMHRELDGVTSPRDRLLAIGRGYMRFVVAHPWHYRLMFLPELHAHEPGCVDDMTRSPTFSLLFECVGRCLEETGDRETDPLSASVAMWAGVHGLATLWLDGPLSQHVPADRFERLTDEVVAVLNRGVAAPSPRPLSG